eukprot:COSAG05_NODE_190_length_14625_cov_2729.566020_11_plen_160_part_00
MPLLIVCLCSSTRYFDATVLPVPLNIFEMIANRIMQEQSKAIRLRFDGAKRTLSWGQVCWCPPCSCARSRQDRALSFDSPACEVIADSIFPMSCSTICGQNKGWLQIFEKHSWHCTREIKMVRRSSSDSFESGSCWRCLYIRLNVSIKCVYYIPRMLKY